MTWLLENRSCVDNWLTVGRSCLIFWRTYRVFWIQETVSTYWFHFIYRSTFDRSAWSFVFFHPRHNGQCHPTSIPDLIHNIIFLSLFLRKSQYFPVQCWVLNDGATGTIFITSLVWRGPWLGIEQETSRTLVTNSKLAHNESSGYTLVWPSLFYLFNCRLSLIHGIFLSV